jgi:transposase
VNTAVIQRVAMMLRRVSWGYESILAGPQREDSRIGEEGRAQGGDRPTLRGRSRHYQTLLCKQLDERGTLEPRKAPGKRPKLDEKATKLLLEDLQERPWATHAQRVEFLFAVSGVRVSEATVCRAVGRLRSSRKKGPQGRQKETSS